MLTQSPASPYWSSRSRFPFIHAGQKEDMRDGRHGASQGQGGGPPMTLANMRENGVRSLWPTPFWFDLI
jgi:hypothetical protein